MTFSVDRREVQGDDPSVAPRPQEVIDNDTTFPNALVRGTGGRARQAGPGRQPDSPAVFPCRAESPAMDSLSQLGLGAAVAVAVMGRRTAVWKAALWGGVAGTLPDAEPRLSFDRFDRGAALAAEWQGVDGVQRIAAFSKGCYKLRQDGGQVLMSDLRMGQEPNYVFTFAVAERHSAARPLAMPKQVGARPDIERGLPWLWRRAWGEPLPPPR